MVKTNKKHLIPVILAGIFIFLSSMYSGGILCCAFAPRFHKNISVNNTSLGGLTTYKAEKILRDNIESYLKDKTLTVISGKEKYEFYYPQINYASNIDALLKKLIDLKPKVKTEYTATISYYLNGLDEVADYIKLSNIKKAKDAVIEFSPKLQGEKMFKITAEKSGNEIDTCLLKKEIKESLNDSFAVVYAKTIQKNAQITKAQLQKMTVYRAGFSTYFYGSTEDRKHNIALSANSISGAVLDAGEVFSFNQVVGDRTESRGYKNAKIIEGGKFVDGIGGGVCQVSTTLYNAALLAGLEIVEQHRHTLSVGYVEPSFDAMVNMGTSDLKIRNNTDGKIFIKAATTDTSVSFIIYGLKDEYEYKRVSEIIKIIPPPPPEIVYGDSEEIVQYQKNGIESVGYLEIYKNGVLIEKKQIRKDKYKALPEIKKILQIEL